MGAQILVPRNAASRRGRWISCPVAACRAWSWCIGASCSRRAIAALLSRCSRTVESRPWHPLAHGQCLPLLFHIPPHTSRGAFFLLSIPSCSPHPFGKDLPEDERKERSKKGASTEDGGEADHLAIHLVGDVAVTCDGSIGAEFGPVLIRAVVAFLTIGRKRKRAASNHEYDTWPRFPSMAFMYLPRSRPYRGVSRVDCKALALTKRERVYRRGLWVKPWKSTRRGPGKDAPDGTRALAKVHRLDLIEGCAPLLSRAVCRTALQRPGPRRTIHRQSRAAALCYHYRAGAP